MFKDVVYIFVDLDRGMLGFQGAPKGNKGLKKQILLNYSI